MLIIISCYLSLVRRLSRYSISFLSHSLSLCLSVSLSVSLSICVSLSSCHLPTLLSLCLLSNILVDFTHFRQPQEISGFCQWRELCCCLLHYFDILRCYCESLPAVAKVRPILLGGCYWVPCLLQQSVRPAVFVKCFWVSCLLSRRVRPTASGRHDTEFPVYSHKVPGWLPQEGGIGLLVCCH